MGKGELIKAAKTGDVRTLERLLSHTKRSSVIGNIKKNLHPNIQDELGYTLLHHATLNSQRETVSFLIRNGASTTIPDSSGSFPLHLASWKGEIEIVKLLTTQGPSRANVDQQSNSEDTALHLAAQYGYCGVVEFLLERHANPMMKNIRGETPLDLAAQFGHIDTVHILISHCPETLRLSRPEMSALHLAARNGHSVVVLSLINAGIPVNTMCKSGSALHEAALCGKENTVKLLLDKGIDINIKNEDGRTVMQLLSDFNNKKYDSIKELIQKYQSGEATPTGRYMKPMRHKLLAIPRKDSKPSHTVSAATELTQLVYHKDEAIVVCGRVSAKVYIGRVRGVTGAFPLKETRLYQDIDGKLNRVYPKDIMESEDGSLHVLQHPVVNDVEQPQPNYNNELSRLSVPDLKGRSASLLSTSDEKKRKSRLTDKEKRFILSNDKGDYSSLAPVSAPSTSTADVRKLTVSPPPKDSNGKDYIGSYYLLEVGNFEEGGGGERADIPPPPSHAPPRPLAMERKEGVGPQYENVKLRSFSSVAELEKPRSTSDGSLLRPLADGASEPPLLPHKRSKSFQISYENVTFKQAPPTRGNEGNTSPISIPALPGDYNNDTMSRRPPMPLPSPTPVENCDEVAMATVCGGKFEIKEGEEDVMVSLMNPNYSKVLFQRGGGGGGGRGQYEGITIREDIALQDGGGGGRGGRGQYEDINFRERVVERREERPTSPGLWIIPSDNNPFAGLVESGSVVEGLSDDLFDSFDDLPAASRSRLKSVWDDRRVKQEWNQIDDVLKDMATGISAVPVETTTTSNTAHTPQFTAEEKTSVFLWLSMLGLQGYTNTFETSGYDDVKFMGGGLLDVEDIKQMGIYENDQGTIMIKVSILAPPPRLIKADSVEEWLEFLQLSYLKDYFDGYSLKKIASLWELELNTIFSVDLSLGHRKRLLYGISELKRINPDWTLPTSSSSSLLPSNPAPGSPFLRVNFARDYTKIQSLKPHPPETDQLELFDDHAQVNWTSSKLQKTKTAAAPTNHTSSSRTHSDPTPLDTPVRGSECAPPDPPIDDTDQATPHTPSPNHVSFDLPPAQVKNYRTLYLGSALVRGTTGRYSAEEACLKLRTQTDSIAKIPQIILSISWKGVKFVNADTKIVVSTHLIRDISHCCPDIEDPRVFAYITKDKETDCSYCHVFMVESKEIADEIILTVGQAFEVAYQAVVRARSKYKTSNPEMTKKVSRTSALKRSFRKLSNSKKSSSQDNEIS